MKSYVIIANTEEYRSVGFDACEAVENWAKSLNTADFFCNDFDPITLKIKVIDEESKLAVDLIGHFYLQVVVDFKKA